MLKWRHLLTRIPKRPSSPALGHNGNIKYGTLINYPRMSGYGWNMAGTAECIKIFYSTNLIVTYLVTESGFSSTGNVLNVEVIHWLF